MINLDTSFHRRKYLLTSILTNQKSIERLIRTLFKQSKSHTSKSIYSFASYCLLISFRLFIPTLGNLINKLTSFQIEAQK